MGELKNIVFNPVTGLFEDSTNPTAHLTPREVRRVHRNRQLDPEAIQLKPFFRTISIYGGDRPLEGSTIVISWSIEKAQRVVATFPSGNTIEFPPVCKCQFVVPKHKCQVRLVAYNERYRTQRTITIHPKRRLLILRLLDWITHITGPHPRHATHHPTRRMQKTAPDSTVNRTNLYNGHRANFQ